MSEDDDTKEMDKIEDKFAPSTFKLPEKPEFTPNEELSIQLDEPPEEPEPAAEDIPAITPEIAHMLSIANQRDCTCALELRWHPGIIRRPEDPEPMCFRCSMIAFLNGTS